MWSKCFSWRFESNAYSHTNAGYMSKNDSHIPGNRGLQRGHRRNRNPAGANVAHLTKGQIHASIMWSRNSLEMYIILDNSNSSNIKKSNLIPQVPFWIVVAQRSPRNLIAGLFPLIEHPCGAWQRSNCSYPNDKERDTSREGQTNRKTHFRTTTTVAIANVRNVHEATRLIRTTWRKPGCSLTTNSFL